MLAAEASIAIN